LISKNFLLYSMRVNSKVILTFILGGVFSVSLGILSGIILNAYLFSNVTNIFFLSVLIGIIISSVSLSIIATSIHVYPASFTQIENPKLVQLFHILQFPIIGLSIILSIGDWHLRLPMVLLTSSAFLLWHFTGGCPFANRETALRKRGGEIESKYKNGFVGYFLKSWLGLNVSKEHVEIILYVIAIILFSWYAVDILIHLN